MSSRGAGTTAAATSQDKRVQIRRVSEQPRKEKGAGGEGGALGTSSLPPAPPGRRTCSTELYSGKICMVHLGNCLWAGATKLTHELLSPEMLSLEMLLQISHNAYKAPEWL